MKAIIERIDGLYIIRITGDNGSLYDAFVVEGVEIMRQDDQSEDLRFALERHC